MSDLLHAGAVEMPPFDDFDNEEPLDDVYGIRICLVCQQPFRGDSDVCPGCDLITLPFGDALDYESDALLWDGD